MGERPTYTLVNLTTKTKYRLYSFRPLECSACLGVDSSPKRSPG